MRKKEDVLQYIKLESRKPVNMEELAEGLGVKKSDSRLKALLDEMEKEGKVVLTRKGLYGIPEKMNLHVGRLQANVKGFAFLIPDEPGEQDVFIYSDNVNGAMHNDRVIVRPYHNLENGYKREGKVIRILERANEVVVGTFEKRWDFGYVVPDDRRVCRDILIPKKGKKIADDGDKVVVEMLDWPKPGRSPEGKIVEILGHKDDPGADILSIVRKYRLPEKFPSKVIKEAEGTPESIAQEEVSKRKDLRDLTLVTIDGEDAKDLDDAVSLAIQENGNYYLGVHIADVGYYVKEGSELDQEALKRATSVYLVDRVIPMLPRRLSNGICSLNAKEDRLAMSCFMEINRKGEVVSHEICRSVINVKERMTYTDVKTILTGKDEELLRRYREYLEMFKKMASLCEILRKKRLQRGAIDFELPEAKVKLNESGEAVEILKIERSIAEMIIEEFMVAANETVAEHYYWLEVPFLYRVHEEPDADDITALNDFLGAFGYYIKKSRNGKIEPRAYQQVLEKVKGRGEEKAVGVTMLRSMKHARYAPAAIGHFGLGAKYYSHFTSPIRRYPDLAIHRVIGEVLDKGKLMGRRKKYLTGLMEEYAKQSSLQERIAEEAERESVELKKVEYMRDFVGETFSGHISGVKSFGFFVELDNTVEGLVHVSNMNDDYYIYDEARLALRGEHMGKTYRIGDEVSVVLTGVNPKERKIDFELVEK